MEALEQELQGPLLARDLKRAEEERDAAYRVARTARQEKDDMRRAYCQDNPIRCRFRKRDTEIYLGISNDR
ncbi:hypothetical protein LIER_39230 [Lithospermum erythrorhizon]|uniref:Uncharacterized protein n=1 Tax=Lithospermum erythrorhizon TaxID=34254 RepID=A0AAV3QER9_LITER